MYPISHSSVYFLSVHFALEVICGSDMSIDLSIERASVLASASTLVVSEAQCISIECILEV